MNQMCNYHKDGSEWLELTVYKDQKQLGGQIIFYLFSHHIIRPFWMLSPEIPDVASKYPTS